MDSQTPAGQSDSQPESRPGTSPESRANQTAGQPVNAGPPIQASSPLPPVPPGLPVPAQTPAAADEPGSSQASRRRPILIGLFFILVLAAASLASYQYGYSRGHAAMPPSTAAANRQSGLQIPADATIISQCAKGRGTQYIMPKDIPHGPVYNVYQGKVIGLEYMIGKDDLFQNKDYLSLPLFGGNYDHVDVGLLSQGHAGFPSPHYHVDIYKITPAESAAITCK